MGTEVIVNCLDELTRIEQYGTVQNVYFLAGAARNVSKNIWSKRTECVAGRVANAYNYLEYVVNL